MSNVPPCRHFSRNQCKFGDLCMFSHSMHAVNQKERSPHPCMYFTATGQCKYGAQCRYIHQSKTVIVQEEDEEA